MTRNEINRAIDKARGHILIPYSGSSRVMICAHPKCEGSSKCDSAQGLIDWHEDKHWPTLMREMMESGVRFVFDHSFTRGSHAEISNTLLASGPLMADPAQIVCLAYLKYKEIR